MSGKIAFRPRARIMKTLGEELISSDSVAIIELVKNSYDADAQNVLINFTGPLKNGGGKIEVIDDGIGMSLDTIQTAWMEPATPTKYKCKESPNGRRMLGEKGIGRFAAARLATKTELISRRVDDKKEARAFVDWTQFDDEEKYLDEIEILTETRLPEEICRGGIVDSVSFHGKKLRAPNKPYHGTILRVINLKQSWETIHFEDLQRGLSRLISPFTESSNFKITVSAPAEFERFSTEIQPPAVVKYPHYTVTGEIKASGAYEVSYTIEATKHIEKSRGHFRMTENGWNMIEEDANNKLPSSIQIPVCGPLKVELRIWDRDDLGNIIQITKSNLSNVRKDLDSYSGINIYRDGFRVLPYGEPNNDWLRLDLRRVQNPTLRVSNNQVLGYIAISADANPELKDQSNREGLRESQALMDMSEIVKCVLARMESIRKKARNPPPQTESHTPEKKEKNLFSTPSLNEISDHIKAQHPDDSATQDLIAGVEKDLIKQIEDIKNVVARYQGLATLGQLIDVVLHQGRQPLSKIVNESVLGKEDIEELDYQATPLLKKLHIRLQKISTQSGVLDGVFKRIEPFGGRKRGRPAKLYLENVVHDSFEIFSDLIHKAKVHVQISKTQTLVRIDPAELQEVFVNLIQNSLYWLKNCDADNRKIVVTIRRTQEEYVEIIFADSGPGVPFQDRHAIFDPYFSNRKDGVGLGLSISGEIISDYYGGSIELMDDNKLGGAAFRITLRKRV